MKPQTRAILRQGDVALAPTRKPTAKLTPVPKDAGRVILAYGEVTGHAHQVIADIDTLPADAPSCALMEAPDGRRFLFVERPCSLTHDEHGPIALTPGCYEVIRQVEYTPEAIRTVAD